MMRSFVRKGSMPLASSTSAIAIAAVLASSAVSPARADDVLSQLDDLAKPILASDGTITHYGVTIYGTVDIGAAYESHGAPSSQYYSNGTDYMISPNSNKPTYALVQSGLSATKVGVKGKEDIIDGLSVVFGLEEGFNPLSFQPVDGLRSLTSNNGFQDAAQYHHQSANNDSSLAGQPFNRGYWAGIRNPVAGQLTFGRHTTLLAEAVGANDPLGGSQAFSLVGFSSTAAGGGNTEDVRLDQSLRYTNTIGPVRFGALYQLPNNTLRSGGDDAIQASLGVNYQAFTFDLVYALKHDAVSAASLTLGGPTSSTNEVNQSLKIGFDPNKTVAATISDNTAYAAFATYKPVPEAKLFVGYELIDYGNSSNLTSLSYNLAQADLMKFAGYNLYLHSDTNYNVSKVAQYVWFGGTYKATDALTFAAAYYHLNQNNMVPYGQGTASAGYGSTVKNSAGQENVVGLDVDYQLTKRLDVYAGVSWSQVGGGVDYVIPGVSSSAKTGYTYNNDVTPAIGARFIF